MKPCFSVVFAYFVLFGAICVFDIITATACKGRTFQISGGQRTWEEAKTRCSDNEIKGILASVKDEEAQNSIVTNAQRRFPNGYVYFYLGGSRNTNGNSFRWVDGTVFTQRTSSSGLWTKVGYTAWRYGEVGNGLCVQLVRESNIWGWNAGSCTVENNFICETEAPRTISFSPSNYTSKIGDPITISGTISELYTEPLTVTAIYNSNQRVTLQTDYNGTSFSYRISGVTASHIGTIQIEIVGKKTACKTVTSVDLQITKSFSLDNSEIVATYGNQQSVTCTATGNSIPTVQWKRSGAEVATTSSSKVYQTISSTNAYTGQSVLFVTDRVTWTEAGIYVCEATNWNGDGGNTRSLTVQVSADIAPSHSSTIANYSQRTSVGCASAGFPRPTVTWKKNGTKVSRSSSSPIYQVDIETTEFRHRVRLYINISDISQAGEYICTSSNGVGTAKSRQLILYVPANISVTQSDVTVEQYVSKTVNCTTYGNPKPVVRWFRSNQPLKNSNSYAITRQRIISHGTYFRTNELNLNITDVTEGGIYECRVESNSAGPAKIKEINVKVSPNITLTRSSVVANFSQPYQVDCVSYGNPQPTVSWKRSGNPIAGFSSFSVIYKTVFNATTYSQTTRLHFTITSVMDSGFYICQTTNDVGALLKQRTLEIQVPANISISPTRKVATIPDKFVISCESYGFPRPTTEWTRNGNSVTFSSTDPVYQRRTTTGDYKSVSKLFFHVTTIDQLGEYKCQATNVDTTGVMKVFTATSLLFSNGSYYTNPNSTHDYKTAKEHCESVGGYLPTLSVLSNSFMQDLTAVQIWWLQENLAMANTTMGSEDYCIAFNTSTKSITTRKCIQSNRYICVFSALEILNTRSCYHDRITVQWKDMTINNGSVTHVITAVNNNHSVNVSKIVTKTSTSNHIYTSTIGNLKPDISYDVSVIGFSKVLKLGVSTVTAVTSNVFRDVRGEMSLETGVCKIEISIPEKRSSGISEVKLRYVKTKIENISDQRNWTEAILFPNASLKHSVVIGADQHLFATFQPITIVCRNTVFKVNGQCKPTLSEASTPLPMVAIASSCFVFLLVVFVLVLIVVYRDRLREWISQKKSRGSTKTNLTKRYKSSKQTSFSKSTDTTKITKLSLMDFYIDSSKNGHKILKSQFKAIKEPINNSSVYENTTVRVNANRQQYENIMPHDYNRVTLRGVEGNKTHHINTCYVEGYKRPRKWIATDGPLDKTVDDFWMMVWKQHIRVIVVLDNLSENSKSERVTYWPDKPGQHETCGGVTVTVVEVIMKGSYVMRKMNIVESNCTYEIEQRIVTQYHYIAWPDHGVPYSTTGLIRFMKEIQETQMQLQSKFNTETPTAVYCSVDAGRTGTFIGFDYLMEELSETGSVDIFNAVRHMQEQRVNMVETLDQYMFLHKLLAETSAFEETDLTQLERFPNSNKMRKEFNDISMLFDKSTSTPVKLLDVTPVSHESLQTENVYTDIEDARIFVYKIEAYNPADNLIIGEEPTADRVENFLSTLLYENTEFIVQLEKPMKLLVWPNQTNQEITQGGIKLKFMKGTTQGQLQVAKISVEDSKRDKKSNITLLEFVAWTENDTPTNEKHLIDSLRLLESMQWDSPVSSLVILTRTGYSRSIVFCAVWNLITRYKAEGMVDVFRTVKDITDSLPEMHLTVEQYKACYSLIKTYVESYKK